MHGVFTEDVIDIGDTVVCDICNADYTDSEEKGGMVVDSSAVCPECQPGMEASVKLHNEEQHVDARCPEGVEFRTFVLGYRGGNNKIAIGTWG